MTTNRNTPARSRVVMAIALLVACRPAADLTEQPRPAAARPVLSLRAEPLVADTLRVSLTLETTSTSVLGSLTSEVSAVPGWRFSGCASAQGHPLLACNATAGVVKLAAAWVEGAANGAIVTLTFVRDPSTIAGSNTSDAPDWQLAVLQAHSVGGESMARVLDVRRDIVR